MNDNKSNIIKEQVESEKRFMVETITENFPPIKPTPLSSLESQEKARQIKVDEFMDFINKDIELGMKSFFNASSEAEKQQIIEITGKLEKQLISIMGIEESDAYVTLDDCLFLENIAKRKIASEEFQEASSMFRLIIQLNGLFGGAWVGWAVSEQQLGNTMIVEQIYNMATELLPFDDFITLFAADFYIQSNQKERAKAILERSKERLLAENMQNSKSFEAIQEAFNAIGKGA